MDLMDRNFLFHHSGPVFSSAKNVPGQFAVAHGQEDVATHRSLIFVIVAQSIGLGIVFAVLQCGLVELAASFGLLTTRPLYRMTTTISSASKGKFALSRENQVAYIA
jgi:hypothetical protein